MNKYDYATHPMAALFPMLPADEFKKLKADIEKHGQLEPITLSKDGTTLLDGRNRLRACKELGLTPLTTTLSDGSESDFIWGKNILRRHLTSDQRAVIGHKWADAEKEAAAARQKASQAKPGEKIGTRKVGVKTPAPSKDRHATRKALAKKARVSEHKTRQVETIAKKAPEVLEKVEAGEIALKDAVATVTPPKPTPPDTATAVEQPTTPTAPAEVEVLRPVKADEPTFWNLDTLEPSVWWDAWVRFCKERWINPEAVLLLLNKAHKHAMKKAKVKP